MLKLVCKICANVKAKMSLSACAKPLLNTPGSVPMLEESQRTGGQKIYVVRVFIFFHVQWNKKFNHWPVAISHHKLIILNKMSAECIFSIIFQQLKHVLTTWYTRNVDPLVLTLVATQKGKYFVRIIAWKVASVLQVQHAKLLNMMT